MRALLDQVETEGHRQRNRSAQPYTRHQPFLQPFVLHNPTTVYH